MTNAFELEWLGGPSGARLRRRRPGADDLPWGSLDARTLTASEIEEGRRVWTQGAFTEYASAAGFSALASALLECRAPIDLTAAAADCAVDEMAHTELAARLLERLDGAAPLEADFEKLSPVTTPNAPALVRAAELAIKISCVGETLSVPVLRLAARTVAHPLTRAVVARLLRDEGAHARIGHWFFEWADERLTAGDREHLARVAERAIATYAPLWQRPRCASCVLPAALGGVADDAYRGTLLGAVRERVVPSLARWGIAVDVRALHDEARAIC
jgi:hypothetical protein